MDIENVYGAPASKGELPAIEVPEEILKKIKNGWITAVISGVMTLAVTAYSIYVTSVLGLSAWNALDVLLIFGFAFGIYKKSRVCAVLMFAYFVVSKIEQMSGAKPMQGIFMSIIFLVFYWQAMIGTFQYHAYLKDHA